MPGTAVEPDGCLVAAPRPFVRPPCVNPARTGLRTTYRESSSTYASVSATRDQNRRSNSAPSRPTTALNHCAYHPSGIACRPRDSRSACRAPDGSGFPSSSTHELCQTNFRTTSASSSRKSSRSRSAQSKIWTLLDPARTDVVQDVGSLKARVACHRFTVATTVTIRRLRRRKFTVLSRPPCLLGPRLGSDPG